jgi:hypothetical protein
VNKKKQKNFTHWRPFLPGETGANGQKFFGSFFQKRTSYFISSFSAAANAATSASSL